MYFVIIWHWILSIFWHRVSSAITLKCCMYVVIGYWYFSLISVLHYAPSAEIKNEEFNDNPKCTFSAWLTPNEGGTAVRFLITGTIGIHPDWLQESSLDVMKRTKAAKRTLMHWWWWLTFPPGHAPKAWLQASSKHVHDVWEEASS